MSIETIRASNTTTQAAARELGRGLMRGDRASCKVGYSHENAALAALDVFALPTIDALELRAYLLGFAIGLAAGGGDEVGDAMFKRLPTPAPEEFQGAYQTGKRQGRREPVGLTCPADIETAAARREREREEAQTMRECGCGATTQRECAAGVEGYFTSITQRSDHELTELAEGDGCEAARVLLLTRSNEERS